MPDDIAGGYDPVGDMWVSSEDADTEIKAGCGVRLRIIGVTIGAELVRPRLSCPSFKFCCLRYHPQRNFLVYSLACSSYTKRRGRLPDFRFKAC